MLDNFKKILVMAPHTDDAEIGCGGTIAKLGEAGGEIFWAVFSKAFVPKDFSSDSNIVLKELKQSAKIMRIKPKNLIIYDYPARHFPECRQDILEKMVKLNKKIEPDLILLPSTYDIHQDHQVISQEGFRAFKKTSSILGYEYPWNNRFFKTDLFVSLHERHIFKKIKSLSCYRSQNNKPYISEDLIKSWSITHGVRIDVQYAEAFEVIRLIII